MNTSVRDGAWLDRMYNNRALVPEHATHFANWRAASAQTRATQRVFQDVAYGTGLNESLDIFPAQAPDAPVVVFIHGGYWRSLDKSDHSFVAPTFIQQGACVVVPNYALCPVVTIPQIVLQMVKCLAWVARNIHRFGADARRLSVIGHSAGGHLATMLLTCDWPTYGQDLPPQLVRKVMSLSGLYELESVRATPFLTDSLRLTEADAVRCSPAWLRAPQDAVLYTVAGAAESDEFVRHNSLMQQAWGPQIVPVSETQEGLNHFSILEALVEPGQRVNQLALQLLKA